MPIEQLNWLIEDLKEKDGIEVKIGKEPQKEIVEIFARCHGCSRCDGCSKCRGPENMESDVENKKVA